jgi:serine/tyrosine/threonine adenylyltransferase
MHHLGVPTTRALSLVSTGDPVMRDMFYDGNPAPEPGAVVCRVSPSFLRFGNYEIHASSGEHALLNQLIDFTIEHYFPEFLNDRLGWFREVCRRTARLMVDWMRVGFVHGVMNTDNLSILGLTIDYGPYGWIDNYDPLWTPNTTDLPRRRYCFGRQPEIAQWNLLRLADALSAVVEPAEDLSSGIELFVDTYNRESAKMTAAKFGLSEAENDLVLAKQAYALMARHEMDMTVFFRCLSENRDIGPSYYGAKDGEGWLEWLAEYGQRVAQIGRPEAERLAAMQAVNPWFIPRNYLAQVAIEAAEQGDLSELEQLMKAAQSPYSRESLPAEFSKFGAIRPDWARQKAGCSALSCSS